MLSTDFDFFAPTELPEALRLLEEHPEAKVLAGGMSMVPAMNLGLLQPSFVLSLNHIPALAYVKEDGDTLRIGAMTRHARIKKDPLVARHAPLLAQAAALIADVQVRHRGTIGGSVAHADPAADYLPPLVALDATITLARASGERTVKARDFFLDVMMTALEPSEVLVEIQVPKLSESAGSAYLRLAHVEGSFAIVNAAAITGGGRSTLVVGGAVPTPVLVDLPVDLEGDVSAAELEQIGEAAYEACAEAYGDLSGPTHYRRAMARVFARRAVARALEARGGAA